MKRGVWWYWILFLVFLALVAVLLFQNLSWDASVKVFWMETTPVMLAFFAGLLGLLQWIFLVIFIRSFFTSMQRAELSKFDLDKPL